LASRSRRSVEPHEVGLDQHAAVGSRADCFEAGATPFLSSQWLCCGLLLGFGMTVAAAASAQTAAIAGAAVRVATGPVDSPDAGHSNFVAPVRSAPKPQPEPVPWWGDRGHGTFGFQLGYAVENVIPRNLSHINLLVAQPQLGLIAWHRPDSRLLVQRFEILTEGFFGNAVHPGGRVEGQTLIFGFDGKPYGSVMPFFDLGGESSRRDSTRAPLS